VSSTATQQKQRINLRLQTSAKETIERAASFEGKTLSSYILSSTLAMAEKTIRQHESIELSRQQAQGFLDALSKPVRFNGKLTDAFTEYVHRVITQ